MCCYCCVANIGVIAGGERFFGYYLWPDIMAKVGHASKRLTLEQLVKFRLNIASNRQLRGQRETKPKVGGGK